MKLRYRLIVSAIVLLPIAAATGQVRILNGTVVDSAGKPVARAQVFGGNPFRETQTGPDGRFRLAMTEGNACSIEVIHRGFLARQLFEPCPDTTIRMVLRRAAQRGPSFEELRDRCGMRATDPCSDPGGLRFIAISSGQSHSCGITTDSTAWCWGDGRKGQLGHARREVSRFPQRVTDDKRFASIAAGGAFTCGRTAAGEVFCWGTERTVPGWPQQTEVPVSVRLTEPATALTTGRRHACVLDSAGRASCWGWNVDGETGIGSSGVEQSMVSSPTPVMTDARFTMLSAGFGFTCGVTTEKSVLCWGSNVDHVLGATAPDRCGDISSIPCSSRPVSVAFPEPVAQVSSGTAHACALSEAGVVYCWGSNASGQTGNASSAVTTLTMPSTVTLPMTDRAIALSSGGLQTCALMSNQLAYCWGTDALSFGQNREHVDHMGPSVAAGGQRVRAISAGQVHVCAIDAATRIRCWGDTIFGALGIR